MTEQERVEINSLAVEIMDGIGELSDIFKAGKRIYDLTKDPQSDWTPCAEGLPAKNADGYHTFNELYHHRAVLFSVICNEHPELAWKSLHHHKGGQPMYEGMFIVGINTPAGQATYHYDVDPYWEMFDVPVLENAPEWDGHTPAQAIERIASLARERENPKPKRGVIFIGYQGVGKSTVAGQCTDYIDLESGNFWVAGKRSEEWYEIYCNIAEHLCQQGKHVFVSSHAVVRERLRKSACNVCVIYPSLNLRDAWVKRLSDRYTSTGTEKDFKAWKNAEEKYEENITDLMAESSFGHIVIEEMPYSLLPLLSSYATEPKGEAHD